MAREREGKEAAQAARRARGPREQGTGGPEERVGGSLAERVAQTTLSPNGLEPKGLSQNGYGREVVGALGRSGA